MKKRPRHFLRLIAAALILLGVYGLWATRAAADFPVGRAVAIPEGATISRTGEILQAANAVRSPLVFRAALGLLGGNSGARAGDYWFEKPLSTWQVAWRLARGEFTDEPVRVTVPEGLSAEALVNLLLKKFPRLERPELEALIAARLGELLPDTYFWPPGITAEKVITNMVRNFERQTAPLAAAIAAAGRPQQEILALASLVEKEASDYETRRLIAGVLWKRLDAGMPLQVDVAPETYEKKDLPPGPIANVSLAALRATLDPEPSDYWYYLSDRRGETHYAVDFSEHKENKSKYLQ